VSTTAARWRPTPASPPPPDANACGIKDDGTAWCWGDNFNGQKGDGTATTGISGQQYVAPSQVTGGHTWKQLAPGDTTCGIDSGDVTWCWGRAFDGTLGTGQDTVTGGKQTSPVQVAGPITFVELSSSLCGRTAAGDVSCWGPNDYWDLGIGQNTPLFSNVPVPLKAIGLSKAMP
jgi:alpha-tubulin suppressor-like RCC1 family protein